MAEDTFNNTFTGYSGTVTFTSTDKNASTKLPGNALTLASGVGTFTATLTTAGNQIITVADKTTSTITGASNAISLRTRLPVTWSSALRAP